MHSNSAESEALQYPVEDPKWDVVCFGFLTHCQLLLVDQMPPQNGGALVLDSVETVGDDAAIVASILTKWSVPVRFISSPVGKDYHGEKVREHLEAWGIDTCQRISTESTTPFEIAILDPSGARTYFQRRELSALAELKPPSATQLAGAGLLYVDWYDGPTVVEAMETAFSQGVPVFLNLESQYDKQSLLTGLLRNVSICQVSMDEPDASGSSYGVARSLISQGVDTALVTRGADGCVVARAGEAYCVPPPPVKIVDCYGAGAAFSAGIIYGVRANWPLESIARFASAYAGLKCEQNGIASLPVCEVLDAAATLDAQTLSL